MYVTKGGWLGQTFALAKFNDSFEGKRPGIRRSKEERKGMVETFIKRYQKLNNGDFPSLNLTRKEVGGSFYTVREIVREIIQENRVLAPPKLPSGDQNMENFDSFLEHHPLGSMSVDLNVHVAPPKDTENLLKEYEFRSAKVLSTRSINEPHQGKLDSDNIVDGSMNTTERNEEVKDQGYAKLLVERGPEEHKGDEEIIHVETSRISGGDKVETTHAAVTNDNEEQTDIESLERSNKEQNNEGTELEPRMNWRSEVVVVETTHVAVNNEVFEKPKNTELLVEGGMRGQKDEINELIANQTQKHKISEDVEVGTFPLKPVSNTVDNMDQTSSERELLDGDLEEKDTENRELGTGEYKQFVCNEMHLSDNSTDVVVIKSEEEITGPLPESKPILACQKTQKHPSTKENIVPDVNDNTDVKLGDTLPTEEEETLNSANGTNAQSLDSKKFGISLQLSNT